MPSSPPQPPFPCRLGMVFGVFDGLHPGHLHFLEEASHHCDQLIIVVAPDIAVERLKKKTSKYSDRERRDALAKAFPRAKVVLGDREQGTWRIVREHHPDYIFLGYDQQALGPMLKALGHETHTLSPHQPHRYKSSLLHTINAKTES